MQDGSAKIERAERRILIADTTADVDRITRRIAFSRAVGPLIPEGELDGDVLGRLRQGTYRVGIYELKGRTDHDSLVSELAERVRGRTSLDAPDLELSVVRGDRDYFALTKPSLMNQGWARRRPRKRAFFHPAAIFPKLARALVNLSRVDSGEVLLDPFCGTGSLLIEAREVGANPVGVDLDRRMVSGSRANMLWLHQDWLGILRADSAISPLRRVDAIATDVPYGRASSTAGAETEHILDRLIRSSSSMLGHGSRLVVMHPKDVEVQGGLDLDLEEEHHLYIHRKLTRTISVLRRV